MAPGSVPNPTGMRPRNPAAMPAPMSPDNHALLRYFGSAAGTIAAVGRWDAGPEPYRDSGCHPDAVMRLWQDIGRGLPADCRCRVGTNPALAHPGSGLVFGVVIGTQYAIRVPAECIQEALSAGLKTFTTWPPNERFDVAATFGPGWFFGAWSGQEAEWCRRLYLSLSGSQGHPPPRGPDVPPSPPA